jgi:MoxR-like ATPase
MSIEQTATKLKKVSEELKTVIKGRDNVIDSLVLAIASNNHALLLGKFGEAKTLMAGKLAKASGLKYYEAQIHQETIVKDITGLLNPVKYRQGEIDIIKTKFWDAEIIFLDEVLRGRTEFLDMLLEVMIERKTTKTLLGEVSLPVLSVIATSNPISQEYNTERLDLALKDRFFAIVRIDHLIEDKKYDDIRQVLNGTINGIESVNLKREELIEFANYAKKNVTVDIDTIIEIFRNANENKSFPFSTRFIKLFKEVCQVHALLDGRKAVDADDFVEIGFMMLSNRFDNLTESVIEEIINDSVMQKDYVDLMAKIRGMESPHTEEENFKKAFEIFKDTKEDYASLPTTIKRKVDAVIKGMEKSLSEILESNPAFLDYDTMKELDTDRFKKFLKRFAEINTVETRFMTKEEYKKTRKAFVGVSHCSIVKEKKLDYVKMKIVPILSDPKSMAEVKKVKALVDTMNLKIVF